MIYFDDRHPDKYFPPWLGKVIALLISLTGIIIFIYFFIRMNYQLNYIIVSGCFLLSFVGILMLFRIYLLETEKTVELTFEKTRKQVKRLDWLTMMTFYISGLCFFGGLIVIAQKSIRHYSIIIFSASILSLVICISGLLWRKMTKQHYELKQQQQEMIELLSGLKQESLLHTSES